jgi:Tfp pilus assembly protein PilN
MTTAVKEKKPFLPQRKPQVQAGGGGAGAVALRGPSVNRPAVSSAPLTIGGEPRVHLLPQETMERKKAKLLKRRLLFVAGGVVAIVALGYVLATVDLTAAQGQLNAARTATSQLLVQQSKYGAVTKIKSDSSAIQQAQKEATTQEILWAPYLTKLENSLPSGATLQAVDASIDSPLGTTSSTSPTASIPLEGPRIATVQLTVSIAQSDIPGWLNTLPSIKGFVDATPGSVTSSTTGSSNYLLVVTIHMNSLAVSNRFTKDAGVSK